MAKKKTIKPASLDWVDNPSGGAAPRSAVFDDIYFAGDGPAETRHVFLDGNGLPTRFEGAQQFSIGELGFGAGLNFLASWDAWKNASKPPNARLFFFSVEAFPLTVDALAKAQSSWPQFADLSHELCAQYPPLHAGFHQVEFGDGVVLTLFFGEALEGLQAFDGAVNAWFLDGFSPAKNPAMWSKELMRAIATRSANDASAATFTVAGAVKRALLDAGFKIEKRPGFGRKRKMLVASMGEVTNNPPAAKPGSLARKPWFRTRGPIMQAGARIAVIGAGIAGASAAYELTKAGFEPEIFDGKGAASGASGNIAGLIMPRLDVGDTPAAQFHVSAYFHTLRLLTKLNEVGEKPVFHPCGVHRPSLDPAAVEKTEKLLSQQTLPPGHMEKDGDGLRFAKGGVVDPRAFVHALIGSTPIQNGQVLQLDQVNRQWRLITENNALDFDGVVVANALDALRFEQMRSLPLGGSAGQIDFFADVSSPTSACAFGPYIAPAPPFAGQTGLLIGATYTQVALGETPTTTIDATLQNITAVEQYLSGTTLLPEKARPRAAIRCTTPDRLPIVGAAPDWGFYAGAYDGLRTGRQMDYPKGETLPGLYVLTGLGSRGLVTAPLCAAMIAAEMRGSPMPVGIPVIESLHPARFFIRDLKRKITR